MSNLDNLQEYCCNTFYNEIKRGSIKYFESINRYVAVSSYWSVLKLGLVFSSSVWDRCHYCGKKLIKD